jgi:hypothetical protein
VFGVHTYYIKRKKIDLVVKFLEVHIIEDVKEKFFFAIIKKY